MEEKNEEINDSGFQDGKQIYSTKENYMSIGMCLGMSMGMMFGSVFDVGVGTSSGMSMGVLFGLVIGMSIPKKVSTTSIDFMKSVADEIEDKDLPKYLEETTYIDFSDADIQNKAEELKFEMRNRMIEKYPEEAEYIFYMIDSLKPIEYRNMNVLSSLRKQWTGKKIKKGIFYKAMDEYYMGLAENVFTFVRDEIPHSFDINANVFTTKASEVLEKKTGICHAKANLLAALYRYLGFLCGICFEHLSFHNGNTGYVLHAFNAVYVCNEWIFVDARGNRDDVDAQFDKNSEKLAFPIQEEEGNDEYFCYGLHVDAHEKTMETLKTFTSIEDIKRELPDHL